MGRKPGTTRYFRRVSPALGATTYYRIDPECLCLSLCLDLPSSRWVTSYRRADEVDRHVLAGLIVEIDEQDCPLRDRATNFLDPGRQGYRMETFLGS